MLKCCNNIISLGCFDVCEDVSTGILAGEDGKHIVEIKFMSIRIKKELDLVVGEEIKLPKMYINENSEIVFSIKAPSGYLTDCYSFTTNPCLNADTL